VHGLASQKGSEAAPKASNVTATENSLPLCMAELQASTTETTIRNCTAKRREEPPHINVKGKRVAAKGSRRRARLESRAMLSGSFAFCSTRNSQALQKTQNEKPEKDHGENPTDLN
jgi:hypothetical protein